MEINGREVKVFRKLCAFQTASNENHFHTTWKNWIALSSSSLVSSNSQKQLLHFTHTVGGWDDIIHKEARHDCTEFLALLNLNKFVCITCEPRRRNTRDVSNLFRYIRRKPHLLTKPISAHVLHCVYWHTNTHRHRVGSVSALSTLADKINHLPNSWQNFTHIQFGFLSDFWWNEGKRQTLEFRKFGVEKEFYSTQREKFWKFIEICLAWQSFESP